MIRSMVLIGATAMSLGGAGFVYAQQTPPPEAPRARVAAEDVSAFADARLAGLKAGLKLTAEQEKHWPALEAAIREMAKQRGDRMNERREARAERREARQESRKSGERRPAGDAIERMRRSAARMTTRATTVTRLADAAEPLYKSLDDGQKRRFAVLMRAGLRDGAQMGPMHRRGDGPRHR